MPISRLRLEYAANGFLASMRRSFIARHPNQECPIKGSLTDYSSEDQGAFIRAVETALKMTEASTDASFESWKNKRMTGT